MNLAISKTGSRTRWLVYFLALVALCALFPLSGDDWDWAGKTGLSTINGRYLGNLAAQLLTGHLWLKPIVMAAAIAWVTWGATGFDGRRSLMAMALIMLTPTDMFTQVFQWTSGFANYTLPAALFFLAIYMGHRAVKGGVLYSVATALLALAGSLFVENITLGLTVLALGYTIYLTVARRPERNIALWAFAGYLAGAVIMFANPAYWGGTQDGHIMPTLAEMIGSLWENYRSTVAPYLLGSQLPLVIVLTGVVFSLTASAESRRGMAILLQWGTGALGAFFLLLHLRPGLVLIDGIISIRALAVLAYFLCVAAAVFLYMPPGAQRERVVLRFLAAAFVSGPLLAVNPIGARCLFAAYVLLISGTCGIISYLEDSGLIRLPKQLLDRAAGTLAVCGLGMALVIYGAMTWRTLERERDIAAQLEAGKTEIHIEAMPISGEYVWQGDLSSPWTQHIFKLYYDIPDEYTIVVEDE